METEPSKAEPPKRKRHWFQFSLRTLFVAMTILALQCAVCFPALKEWQAQPDTWSDTGGTGAIAVPNQHRLLLRASRVSKA